MGTWYRRQVHGTGLHGPSSIRCGVCWLGFQARPCWTAACVRAQAGVSLAGGRGVPASVLLLRCRCCFAHAGSNSRGIRTQPGWCRICARYSALVRAAGANWRGCPVRLAVACWAPFSPAQPGSPGAPMSTLEDALTSLPEISERIW